MPKKTCNGPCRRVLHLETGFHKDAKLKSGYRGICKFCSRKVKSVRVHRADPDGRAAHDGGAPDGYHTQGRSTLFNGKGEVVAEWVKTAKSKEDEYKAIVEACKRIADDWPNKFKPVKAPKHLNDDLLATYVMGDAHVGMLAWSADTGNRFDLEIAERHLCEAADKLVTLAPPAKHALIVNVGDFTHSDNFKGETAQGTRLDVDGRYPKVIQVAIRTLRRIIDRALEKHEHVTIINASGNHDTNTSIMLAICLAQFYEKEPRVTVDTSPQAFHYYRFGKTFIGVTHGDRAKKQDLGPIMATDRPEDWGATKHRYWLTGHIHHDSVREYHGVVVESFRTLAGKDAWHHGQGYRAGRDMKMDVYHRSYGRINRHIVGVDQLTDA
jgi:hypothetical protein